MVSDTELGFINLTVILYNIFIAVTMMIKGYGACVLAVYNHYIVISHLLMGRLVAERRVYHGTKAMRIPGNRAPPKLLPGMMIGGVDEKLGLAELSLFLFCQGSHYVVVSNQSPATTMQSQQ